MPESLVGVGGPGDVVEALTTSAATIALLLLVNAAATFFMTGVIWFVQIVHYPLFARVGAGVFSDYERDHARRTGWVVGIPMLVELAVAIATVVVLGGALAWVGLALLVLIWLSTGLLQVPAHGRLQRGFDAVTHRRLVATNWVRTVAWSTRAVSTVLLLVPPR
jgi:hypothetical protein